MHELLARAMQGVDPDAPDAFWQVFLNLWAMVPWAALFWWNLLFVAVGAVLGWWRGRLWEGVLWAWVLGPIGWIVLLLRPRGGPPAAPPPLPR
ncbi:MAG: hypothetical protein BGP10_00840 [Rhodanobacter sp. 68-29]|uniref:hypothetical protein n=1 Tax=Rhodanobacter sp. PCA2 TaxID=2006117 RepID=UPI00086C1AB7|nr:hypothetical protein [Rhodanobacter sp. PCA2]MBA2078183.1 hypothetical protein [Rhodanobacter sp. PCA2]MBN8923254.1 hypothetical protein [Rhodanobacter sp.]ODU75156.1 MAG: hypothetical protein ABT17_04190 [Rhodanobacter sp. SCN 69-32]OJY59529.1 MAG: hypothetical protein BGP10_00840 [Rhodanobacter sp. 68-29]